MAACVGQCVFPTRFPPVEALRSCLCGCAAVRLILEALISFMPTPGEGAVGAIDMLPDDRRVLAKEVRFRAIQWSCLYEHYILYNTPCSH